MSIKSIKNLNHHAYSFVGGVSIAEQIINDLEKIHKIVSVGNPDFMFRKSSNLTIDDARDIISFHDIRPVGDSQKKVIILIIENITNEAQNALLKTLEEPADYIHFFLIISSRHLLLPTIQSRLLFIDDIKEEKNAEYEEDLNTLVSKFQKATLSKRLEMAKKITDEISDDKKTKKYAIDFVDRLEAEIRKDIGIKNAIKQLEAISFAKSYMNDRAPSIKMLLEYVAMNV